MVGKRRQTSGAFGDTRSRREEANTEVAGGVDNEDDNDDDDEQSRRRRCSRGAGEEAQRGLQRTRICLMEKKATRETEMGLHCEEEKRRRRSMKQSLL